MSSVSAVWRDGRLEQVLVSPENAPPVRELTKPYRELAVDHVQVTLHGEDGRWSVGTLALHGVWLRKDGSRSVRNGNMLMAAPLTVADGAPQWLVERLAALVSALDLAYAVAER